MPDTLRTWPERIRWLAIAAAFAVTGVATAFFLHLWLDVANNSSLIASEQRRNDRLTDQVAELKADNDTRDHQLAQANAKLIAAGEKPIGGTQGPAGPRGQTGRSAYPFAFAFDVPLAGAGQITVTVMCSTADAPCEVTTEGTR